MYIKNLHKKEYHQITKGISIKEKKYFVEKVNSIYPNNHFNKKKGIVINVFQVRVTTFYIRKIRVFPLLSPAFKLSLSLFLQ